MDIKEILQTKEGRVSFLKGLIRLANADGIVDESEFAFYRQAAVALELGEEEILALEKVKSEGQEITLAFGTDREKMFFLIQAVQLCWVDNNYSEAEQKELRNICQQIDISEEALRLKHGRRKVWNGISAAKLCWNFIKNDSRRIKVWDSGNGF